VVKGKRTAVKDELRVMLFAVRSWTTRSEWRFFAKGDGNSGGEENSRSPSGMTTRKTDVTAMEISRRKVSLALDISGPWKMV
jgi:hypothetical protein